MFDDPVAVLVADLRARDPAVPTSGRVPNPRPAHFRRVVLVGAQAITATHRTAYLLIECWAATDPAADRLGASTEALLPDSGTPWNRIVPAPECWVAGPAPLHDPDSGTPRSVMTVAMIQRSRP